MLSGSNRDPNEALETALTVLEAGVATIDELRQANIWRHTQRPQLGKLAMKQGKLTITQVFAILGEQAITGKLFGETASELGYFEDDLYELLKHQAELTPTLADALVTLGVITAEQARVVLRQIDVPPQCDDPVYAETAP